MDWSKIGVWVAIIVGIITAIGVIFTIKQYLKKDKETSDNSVNQNIKGGFFYKSNISQNVNKKKE